MVFSQRFANKRLECQRPEHPGRTPKASQRVLEDLSALHDQHYALALAAEHGDVLHRIAVDHDRVGGRAWGLQSPVRRSPGSGLAEQQLVEAAHDAGHFADAARSEQRAEDVGPGAGARLVA